MKNARKPLAGLIALGAALVIPMAFAQDAATEQQDPTTTHDPAPQEYATPEAATSQPLTWADLDVDGDGRLSREEAANVASLAQVFDDADADGDGFLTQDEYRNYVAQADSAAPQSDGGGDD